MFDDSHNRIMYYKQMNIFEKNMFLHAVIDY